MCPYNCLSRIGFLTQRHQGIHKSLRHCPPFPRGDSLKFAMNLHGDRRGKPTHIRRFGQFHEMATCYLQFDFYENILDLNMQLCYILAVFHSFSAVIPLLCANWIVLKASNSGRSRRLKNLWRYPLSTPHITLVPSLLTAKEPVALAVSSVTALVETQRVKSDHRIRLCAIDLIARLAEFE